uniref:Uncharacterized protein n=1 Tax=viral metagenome TaxID=1070528 RepID=A0A6M3L6P9_9ZZZZ
MTTALITSEVASKQALVNIGDMSVTALDVYNYVKDSLVTKATELKEKSLALHNKIATSLPADWKQWDIEQYKLALALDKEIIEHMATISKKTKPTELDIISDKADKLHKGVNAAIKDIVGPLPDDRETMKGKVKQWDAEAERKRQTEENRLRLEAQKAEEERRITEAAQLEAEGLKAEANAVLEAPQPIVMPTVEKTTPKADMRLYRKTWKYRIIDEAKIPREYLKPDEIKIGGVVRALKEKCKIEGVQIYEE